MGKSRSRKRVKPKRKRRRRRRKNNGNQSMSETHLCRLLKKTYPQLTIKEQDRDLLNPYELDITIPELEIAVEWNGIFHYKPIGGKKRLRKTKAKDRMKIQRLEEMDWFFYVVKHEKRYDPDVVEAHFEVLCEVIDQRLS